MMWETVLQLVRAEGGTVTVNSPVQRIYWQPNAVTSVEIVSNEKSERMPGTHFFSTLPIRELIEKLDPAVPPEVLSAARQLTYRDFITVALIIKQANLFPDNWIYIHEPGLKVGRIENFKNWSPDMVPDASKSWRWLENWMMRGRLVVISRDETGMRASLRASIAA